MFVTGYGPARHRVQFRSLADADDSKGCVSVDALGFVSI